MIITADGNKIEELRQDLMPVKIIDMHEVMNADGLMTIYPASVSFQNENWTRFNESGSYIILDFGKEICGGLRLITRNSLECAKWRITFGESLTEACSDIGYKNATNDHSPRDMEVLASSMSDLTFGQTGFRFVRLELLSKGPVTIQNIFAVSHLPLFDRELEIVTDDSLVNEIIDTAIYTLKLNFQNGYIWDGIKRDRLVWCGDLHPEIITSLYAFGDNDNIKNSLVFLKNSTPADRWMNTIPSYSAWWVINLCDYCNMSGNYEFFEKHKDYAKAVISHFNLCVEANGTVQFEGGSSMNYFLDWSTRDTADAVIGVQSLLCIMAKKYLAVEENDDCLQLLEKLSKHLTVETTLKPVRAFQILAGRECEDDCNMLEKGNAQGFSTFMAYYILNALAKSGSVKMLDMIKEYYGGMLQRGATSFWEDFDITWLENSCRIDEFPKEGQLDIHGDFGKYCYKQFRHSLCHGWSSGVVAFVVEYILGIHIEDGGKKIYCNPHLMELKSVKARIPLKTGWLVINAKGKEVSIDAPEGTEVSMAQ